MASEELVQQLIDQGFIRARGHKAKYFPDDRKDLTPAYDPKYQDIMFFCVDTHEILLNGSNYGGDLKGIHQNILDSYDPETSDTYVLEKSVDESLFQLTFTPLSPDNLQVPQTIGDIQQGTKVSDLKGMPLSQILDDLIFKTIYPTITKPSVSITGSNSTVEAGSTLWTGYGHNFNKGSVVVDDGVTQKTDYTGPESSSIYYVVKTGVSPDPNAGTEPYLGISKTDVSIFNETGRYEPGVYTYTVKTNYSIGPKMKTSKGADPNPIKTSTGQSVENPCPAGSIDCTNSITRNVTLPVFIDDASGTYIKQTLKNWGIMTFTAVQMKGTTSANPIRIKTPRKINTVNSYNEVSGKYDVLQKQSFKVEEITEDINGKDYPYYEYTWVSGAMGAVKFEIITY